MYEILIAVIVRTVMVLVMLLYSLEGG